LGNYRRLTLNITRARTAYLLIAALALSPISCTTPDAISKFSASAVTTLTSADLVFDDMKLSCLREVNSRAEFATFEVPVETDANCTAIGRQADGARATAKILSDYFTAINSLASFGTAKVGSDAGTQVQAAAAAVGASQNAQNALQSMVSFLSSAATSGYQLRQLEKDLNAVSANISAVVDALTVIVGADYINRELRSEEQKLRDRYREFAKDAKQLSPGEKLMLDDRWHADQKAIAAKRASAQSLIAALQALAKGFATLAANAKHLNAKEVPGLLGPYAAQLQALIPQIQKGF
jgi:hypothetical protein